MHEHTRAPKFWENSMLFCTRMGTSTLTPLIVRLKVDFTSEFRTFVLEIETYSCNP